jgi:transposase InsO family protein
MRWTTDACKKYIGVKHIVSTAYHPETQGLVERFNRTLQEMLSMYSREQKYLATPTLPIHRTPSP